MPLLQQLPRAVVHHRTEVAREPRIDVPGVERTQLMFVLVVAQNGIAAENARYVLNHYSSIMLHNQVVANYCV